MLRTLLNQQWKRPFFLVLLLCLMLTLQTDTYYGWHETNYNHQQAYLRKYDLYDRDAFFEGLNADKALSNQIKKAIDNFSSYAGEIPDVEMDIMDLLEGATYMNEDMYAWRSQMYSAPGRLSDTVYDDYQMTLTLSNRLSSQEQFAEVIDNQAEIMRRGIRRGGWKVPLYEAAQAQLLAIQDDFPVQDTLHTDQLLSHLQEDWYILVILTLGFFGTFSTAIQQRITNTVLISKTGMRRYAWAQVLTVLVLTVGCLILYDFGILLACSTGDLRSICWGHPIQAINGYSNILQNLQVWQYLLLAMGLKALYCIMFVSMLLVISLLSRNNIIATLGATLFCGGLVFLNQRFPALYGLILGNCRILVEELCYWKLGNTLIIYPVVFAAAVLVVTAVIWVLILLIAKPVVRRWIK